MTPSSISQFHMPGGFRWSSATAGIKASGRPDLALAEAPLGASAAAVFTTNKVCAAPLVIDRKHLAKTKGRIRAVLVNAGNANCATGKAGLEAAEQSCEALGNALNAAPEFIFPSSTGIIGVPFPTEKLVAAIPALVRARNSGEGALHVFSEAILTTDTRAKLATAAFESAEEKISIVGVAKGSGMIHPNMATMLVYIFTDLDANPSGLQRVLKATVSTTFNAISVDGDTSTNDTVLLMASGTSGIKLKRAGVEKRFASALHEVCASLAEQVIRDGEGAKHFVRLNIEKAKNVEEARVVARSIANSPLVKTAWAGSDPNWGRVLSSVGKSGIAVDSSKIDIYIGEQQVCAQGAGVEFDKQQVHQYMQQPEFDIRVSLGRGKASLRFLTCDLTDEYIHINADYST